MTPKQMKRSLTGETKSTSKLGLLYRVQTLQGEAQKRSTSRSSAGLSRAEWDEVEGFLNDAAHALQEALDVLKRSTR